MNRGYAVTDPSPCPEIPVSSHVPYPPLPTFSLSHPQLPPHYLSPLFPPLHPLIVRYSPHITPISTRIPLPLTLSPLPLTPLAHHLLLSSPPPPPPSPPPSPPPPLPFFYRYPIVE